MSSLARGIACVVLTGVGLLVLLQGDGVGAGVVAGSVLVGGGVTAGLAGWFSATVTGRQPARNRNGRR